MKLRTKFSAILTLSALVCLSACSKAQPTKVEEDKTANPPTKEEVVQKVTEAVDAVKEYGFDKKDQFKSWAETKSGELTGKISALEEKVATLKQQSKEKWQTDWKPKITEKKDALKVKIDAIGGASEKAWLEVKTGVNESLKDLEETFKNASEEFKQAAEKTEASGEAGSKDAGDINPPTEQTSPATE